MKIKKILRKIIFITIIILLIIIIINFWLLVEKMSYDICGDKCIVEEVVYKDKKNIKKSQIDKINIPEINVNAPIIFNSGISEKEVSSNLNKGVVYYSSSTLPNEKGITVLLGHSSNYWWTQSDYNNVFALLPELKFGDEIYIYYNNKRFEYKVSGSRVIGASDWQELKNPDYDSGLALITCWPLGSSYKRYVVFAENIN